MRVALRTTTSELSDMPNAAIHGLKKPDPGKGQGRQIISQCPGKVCANGAVGFAADRIQGLQRVYAAVQQHQVGIEPGDLAGLGHGNRNIGAGKGRGVVNPVADHADHVSPPLQFGNGLEFILGQAFRHAVFNAQLGGNLLDGLRVIAAH